MQVQFDRYIYRLLIVLVVIVLLVGTVVYHVVEKFGWVDAYYFSVVTLATVGYGDFVPHTTFGKIFTTFYIFIGVGIITTFITYTAKRQAYKREVRRARNEDRQAAKSSE